MTNAPKGYRIHETVHVGTSTQVHRARRLSDDEPVILKTIERGTATPGLIARLEQEFEVLEHLDVPGVVRVLDLEDDHGIPVLVLEDVGALSLAKRYRGQRLEVKRVLFLGARIAETLARIHERGVIHCDINPANLLLREDTDEVFIADCGWSLRTTGHRFAVSSHVGGGTLAYASPEQTGRTTRAVDHRTDLYSLGITLYQLIAGRLPFMSTDPLELVHSHLARRARPLAELIPETPAPVSAIVEKLMAKMPEDRYQTARGCVHDLEECRRRLHAGEFSSFVLGQHDEPGFIELSRKRYGREPEAQLIRAAMARVMAGSRELLLVVGRSGIGKSTLIRDVVTATAGARAHFVTGKADQYRKTVPYLALAQALGQLIRQLLTEPSERLGAWKDALRQTVGQDAQVLVEVIPELALLLGPQLVAPRVGATEMENRFHHLFQLFLDTVCTDENPLIVFLDDLQWADSASVKMMQRMLDDPALGHLMLIGCFRSDEVDETHPLMATLERIRAEHPGAITELTLGPLGRDAVVQLLADTLKRPDEECADLARVVHDKTGGNPFFIAQFLTTLHQEGALTFDHDVGGWRWDMPRIEAFGSTDNVADILLERLRRLPADTRRALELAATLGDRFHVETLAMVSGERPDALERGDDQRFTQALASALDQGFLRPAFGGALAFSHDRVRQAVYASVDERERAAQHRRIARSLLYTLDPAERDQRIFEIAGHLAACANLPWTSGDEGDDVGGDPLAEKRLEAAQLCLQAGRQALASTAYEGALDFLRAGQTYLPDDAWDRHYQLRRDLVLAAIEAEYLNDEPERARQLVDELRSHARDVCDEIEADILTIAFLSTRHEMRQVLDTGLAALARLGVEIPSEASARDARMQALRADLIPGASDLEALERLPELTDPRDVATVRIIQDIATSAFFLDPQLMALLNALATTICTRHAPSPLAATQCMNHAYQLVIEGHLDRAVEFGALSAYLVERFDGAPGLVRPAVNYRLIIHPWCAPLRDALQPLARLVQRGLDTGEFEYGFYAACWRGVFRVYAGDPLDAIDRELTVYLGWMTRHRMVLHQHFVRACQRPLAALIGRPADDGEPIIDVPFIKVIEDLGLSMVHLVMGEYRAAMDAAERTHAQWSSMAGLLTMVESAFFYCLAVYACHDELAAEDPDAARKRLAGIEDKRAEIESRARRVPENFAHKQALLEAEELRVRGHELATIMEAYDRAIECARQYGYTREEALACERAADFYHGLGRARIADAYRADAYRAYRRWGARAKVERLEDEHPELVRQARSGEESSSLTIQHICEGSLDWTWCSVIKRGHEHCERHGAVAAGRV